ncbi:hypothetical protein AQUCO_08900002v1 [Aquilegia coerulea]|uniref:Uncharacterized protein n=1 Tax=Aquilegia coerulea TaxID=218851 RepID=A0A2G5C7I5_AQUCA|nr:hypothetical protein AQUCO_08900002v1 [Aquilegia coerulea]
MGSSGWCFGKVQQQREDAELHRQRAHLVINPKEQTSSFEGTLELDGTNPGRPCSRKLSSSINTKKQTLAFRRDS